MANLLIRRVPEGVVKSLKRRAARHRRSLQQELMAVLESAAAEDGRDTSARVAAMIRMRLSRRRRRFTDSAVSIRQDRNR